MTDEEHDTITKLRHFANLVRDPEWFTNAEVAKARKVMMTAADMIEAAVHVKAAYANLITNLEALCDRAERKQKQ